jgi:hypothetical protein
MKAVRVEATEIYCAHLMGLGRTAVAPIVMGHAILKHMANMPTDFKTWRKYSYDFLMASKEVHVLMLPRWDESSGVRAEIDFAESRGMAVKYITPDKWCSDQPVDTQTLFHIVKRASLCVDANSKVAKRRTIDSITHSAGAEFGELCEEVMIANGQSYKTPGKDGIVGEAIDTIACLLDLIHVYNPSITEDYLNTLMATKCAKWVEKTSMVGSPAGT